MADFWAEESDGLVQFQATAWPSWVSTTATCTNRLTFLDQVAAAVGFDPGRPGRHLLVYLSDSATGTAGCPGDWASTSLLPLSTEVAGMSMTKAAGVEHLSHMLGHTLGLGEHPVLACDGGSMLAPSCYGNQRRDPYDVMGDPSRGPSGSLSAPGAAAVGALTGDAVVTLPWTGRGGQVTLAPISGRTGVRGVHLVDGQGGEVWVEFRPATGRDAWLDDPDVDVDGVDAGVLVRQHERFDQPRFWTLLDGSPSPRAAVEPDAQFALPVGERLSVLQGRFRVRVESQTAGTVTVSIAPLTQPFPRDLSGDGVADVLAVDPYGNARVYYGRP